MSAASSSPEKSIHPKLFAIDYESSGAPADDHIGRIALQLGQRVVTTAYEQMVRLRTGQGLGARFIQDASPDREDSGFEVPVLVCRVPCGEDDLPGTSFVRIPYAAPFDVRRGKPREIAKTCIFAMKVAMDGTGLYRPEESGGVTFLSGPEPMREHDLRDHVMGLQVLHFAELPLTADAYAQDVSRGLQRNVRQGDGRRYSFNYMWH